MPAWAPPVNPQDVVGTGHKWLEPVDQEGVHKGVDLQLTKGKPALSPVDGVVTDVGNDPQGLGITVTIRDAQGTETKLGHLDGVHVKKGDQVKQGQQVADVGETGASTGPHLDVRMQDKAGQFQDPTALLGPLAQMPRADKPGPVGAGQEGWGAPGPQTLPLFGPQEWRALYSDSTAMPGMNTYDAYLQDRLNVAQQAPDRYRLEPTEEFLQSPYRDRMPRGLPLPDAWQPQPGPRPEIPGGRGAGPGWSITPRSGEPSALPGMGGWEPPSGSSLLRGVGGLPGAAGIAAAFPQQFMENFIQPGMQAVGEWFNPPPAYAPGLDEDVGGGQDRVHVGTLYRADVGSGQDVGVGQGQGGFASPLPAGGIYGRQKWSSGMGSNATDIFVRRGTPVSAPVSGTIQQGMNGQLVLVGDNGWNFAFRHGMTTAQGHVQEGQQIGIVNDPGLDSLGRAPWGNMPDNYQHLEMSVSRGSPSFPGTPGGGGNVDAAQFLNQIGYQGQEIPRTPGPPDAQGGGGMGFGGGGGGGQFGGGGPGGFPGMQGMPFGMPMGMSGPMGMPPGMNMGMPFPGMSPSMGAPGGFPGQGFGGPGMGMQGPMGMSPGMGMDFSGAGGMPQGMGMDQSMGPDMGMDPMAMGAGPMMDPSMMGQSSMGMDPSMGMGSFGQGGFGQQGFGQGAFGGQQFGGQGMGGQQMGLGSQGGLGSQMQAPAFSGYPGAMPNSAGFGGLGNSGTTAPGPPTPADLLMDQLLQFKPDWTGVNDAQATLKKNATGPLAPFPINTNQLPAAPQSTLKPWNWLNQIYPGSGQDRAPVGSGQARPGWATPTATRGWEVGVGADATTPTTLGATSLAFSGAGTGASGTFTGSLNTPPATAQGANLNQAYFQLAQQQLQEQIQQVNQSFQVQQQQLAQQASQFGMTTQLAQQQQELQQKQFDANQQLQRQLAELQNAQLQQNLGMQSQQFNQQMGLQGAQLGLQQQQLGMLPQQLAAQYGLSAAQLGQGQQQLGVQVQQLNQQYQQAQQAAYQQYLTSGNQDQLQRELANQAAKFQQAQAQIQQAQYGGTMQLNQQQLRGQTGLSLAQMAQQQQQAGYGRQMDIFNSAMSQPWLQQLSGMSQQWGAPGGPQEAGQASAAGLPNMPSQGGGINLPDLMKYFPDINVQQYLQGQTPQVGASPFQQNWQSVMSGLGQFSPFNQNPITLPENPFPFQMPQFTLGQNPYPFNFQPTSVPPEGQMPWAANPSPPDPNPTNPTTTPPGNNYQAGPLTFTGQGSMGTPPTGYSGGGLTYTLPNQQTFTSNDVWNWEQGNAGSSPDQAYQWEMGQHGFPGWNFPIGQGGGFPIGSTVGWNMGGAAAPVSGSGQDRVGSGQGAFGFGETNPFAGGANTGLSGGPTSWTNWGGSGSGTTDPWNFGSPGQGTSGGLLTGNEAGWGTGFGDWTGQQGGGMGGGDPYAGWGTPQPDYGMMGGGWQNTNLYAPYNPNPQMASSDMMQSGQNPLQQGDPSNWGMGPVQQGGGGGGDGSTPYVPPPAPDPGTGDGGHPLGSNTTLDAYKQYQQALAQWQQQQQAYQAFGQQDTAWQNAWNQYYGNWRQHFGQPGYTVADLGQWRQTNPEPTAVQNPGAPPQYQALNPQDFSHWITSQATSPYTPPAAPTMPNYETFAAMDPFQQAGLRTQAQLAGIAWPQYQNMLRQNWGSGGVTAPPVQSPLTMANLNNNTLNNLSFQNLLSVFGQTPQQYQTTYQPYWSQAQVPQVSGVLGGGY